MLIHLLATWIPALLIALSGVLKLSGNPKILEAMTALGVGRHLRLLGIMELAFAALFVGAVAPAGATDRARRRGWAGRVRGRRTSSSRVSGFRARGHPWCRGGTNAAHPADQRGHRAERRGSGARVSELRDPRSAFTGPSGNDRRPWLLHRSVSALRLPAGGLRCTLCREA